VSKLKTSLEANIALTRVNSSASAEVRNSGDRGLLNVIFGKPFSGVLGDWPLLGSSAYGCSLSDLRPFADSAARIAMALETSSGLTFLKYHLPNVSYNKKQLKINHTTS